MSWWTDARNAVTRTLPLVPPSQNDPSAPGTRAHMLSQARQGAASMPLATERNSFGQHMGSPTFMPKTDVAGGFDPSDPFGTGQGFGDFWDPDSPFFGGEDGGGGILDVLGPIGSVLGWIFEQGGDALEAVGGGNTLLGGGLLALLGQQFMEQRSARKAHDQFQQDIMDIIVGDDEKPGVLRIAEDTHNSLGPLRAASMGHLGDAMAGLAASPFIAHMGTGGLGNLWPGEGGGSGGGGGGGGGGDRIAVPKNPGPGAAAPPFSPNSLQGQNPRDVKNSVIDGTFGRGESDGGTGSSRPGRFLSNALGDLSKVKTEGFGGSGMSREEFMNSLRALGSVR